MLKILLIKVALRVAWFGGKALRDKWAKDVADYDEAKK
jgi:hypothetical protein